MKVTALHIYPIKSLGGIALSESKTLTKGLEHDRRWMLVDDKGSFLTQREHARMALFTCEIVGENLSVRYNQEQILIPLAEHSPLEKNVTIWSSKLKAHEVSTEVSAWFSEHLGQKVSLVKMTNISQRPKKLITEPFETELSFADGYPYLILGEASMDELNRRLAVALPMNRFRPNITIATTVAHEEDEWINDFYIGTTKMKVIKPCARCIVPTIDQLSGSKGKEPLKTLTSYRKWSNKIWFGANAIVLQEGQIKVGDKILLGSN